MMNSFELNKIAGAILFTLLVYLGLQNLGAFLFHVEPAKPEAYIVDVIDDSAVGAGDAHAGAESEPDIELLLSTASVEKGMKVAKKCVSCHSFDKGGAKKTGPALYGIVNRDIAFDGSFSYSSVMAGLEGVWDYQTLNAFLKSPRQYARGTKMSFVGLRKAKDRADIIAYLRNNADSPAPLAE